jgi:endo-1,4-beta-D-glucanase Y
MMTRRTALQTLVLSIVSTTETMLGYAMADELMVDPREWSSWKTRFLSPSGRVIDDENGEISHSEGQAFGALLAQAYGDRAAFESIENWTDANLLVRQDHLMAWRWRESGAVGGDDWHSATDGDIFRAWALLRAKRDSGWPVRDETAQKIAGDIAALCLRPDPRASEFLLLTPGAEARSDAERVLFNPSYVMPRALRELGAAFDEPRLIAGADHGESVLAELAAFGPVPDWVDVTSDGFAPPKEHDVRSGYDALRVPLYLVWSENRSHPAVARAEQSFASADIAGHLAVVVSANGDVLAQSNSPGYQAIADLASCSSDQDQEQDNNVQLQTYYPATLELLVKIASKEAKPCKSL